MSRNQAADLADFEDFFRSGEEGTYDGGPATLPPPAKVMLPPEAAEGRVEQEAAIVLAGARARRQRLGRLVGSTMLGLTLFTGIALVVAGRRHELAHAVAEAPHGPAAQAALVPASTVVIEPVKVAVPRPEPRGAAVEPRGAAVEPRGAAVESRGAAVEPRVAAVEPRVAAVEPPAPAPPVPVAAATLAQAPAGRAVEAASKARGSAIAERTASASRRLRSGAARSIVRTPVAVAVAPVPVPVGSLRPAKASGAAVAGFQLLTPAAPAARTPASAAAPARSEAALARFPDAR